MSIDYLSGVPRWVDVETGGGLFFVVTCPVCQHKYRTEITGIMLWGGFSLACQKSRDHFRLDFSPAYDLSCNCWVND